MKKNILLIATIGALAPCVPVATNAATQVYDLKADWSDTQNPNGTWSYRHAGGPLLPNDPFPWAWVDPLGTVEEAVTKITPTSAWPGYLEVGDIAADSLSGVGVRWTAPANGTISVSGTIWNTWGEWALTHNGSHLSGGVWGSASRSAPYDLSLGSAGPNGLLNIPVQAGDQVEIDFYDANVIDMMFGISFTVTLATDSVDPVAAIEDLAIAVFEMNLQNGIENSLDSKLDAAVDALIDANFNNDGAACNSLTAFISAVQAQRGKKITNAQADQLITAAQQIKAMLNCGN